MTATPDPAEKLKATATAYDKWEIRLDRSRTLIVRYLAGSLFMFCAVLFRTAHMHVDMLQGRYHFWLDGAQSATVVIFFIFLAVEFVKALFSYFEIQSQKP